MPFRARCVKDDVQVTRDACYKIRRVDHHRTGKSWRTRESPPPDSTQFLVKRKERRGKERVAHGSIRILRTDVTRAHRRYVESRGRRDVSDLYRSYIRRRDESGVIFTQNRILQFGPDLGTGAIFDVSLIARRPIYLTISDTFQ